MAIAPNAKPIGDRKGVGHDPEKARKVLQAFYRLQPNLSSIARALTDREDISVMPSAQGTYTDNKRIYMSLHPDMIIEEQHERRMCGKRDGHGLMICEACRKYEALMVPLYHEMGHIIFGSFDAVAEDRLRSLLDDFFDKNILGLPEDRIRAVNKRLDKKSPSGYMEAASLVSPYMPQLLNALEDSRVNAGIIRRNPGAGKMFTADIANIMSGGVQRADGATTMWHEQPENAQFIIGVFLIASRIGVRDGWLSESVSHDLDDPILNSMLLDIPQSNSAGDVFEACLPVLERGRELGYFIHEDDEEPEPGDHGDTGDGEDAEGEPEDGMGGGGGSSSSTDEQDEGDDDAEGSGGEAGDDDSEEQEEDGGSSSEADSEDEGEDEAPGGGSSDDEDDEDVGDEPDGGGGSGDESTPTDGSSDDPDVENDDDGMGDSAEAPGDRSGDPGESGDDRTDDIPPDRGAPEIVEELFDAFNPHEDNLEDEKEETDESFETALKQESFESPSGNIRGLELRNAGEHGFDVVQKGSPVEVDKAIIQKGLGPLRVAFSENKQSSYDRNRKSGRVNPKVLARRVPFDDPRLFRKKRVPGKRDYHVLIGLDISGSTGGYSASGMMLIDMIKTCALLQAEMLAQVGVDFEIYAHTGGVSDKDRFDYKPGTALNMFRLKGINDPWNPEVRNRVQNLSYGYQNLDGHTLEFYRQQLDKSDKTDRLIVYYTDGAMPAENYTEELEILQRECKTIQRRGYDVLAVAIQNNDPQKYGLDTVRVDVPDDMQKVVLELQRRLK